MKLLIAAFSMVLSAVALHAQAVAPAGNMGYGDEVQLATVAALDAEFKPHFAWARGIVTVRYDPNSSDIAKKETPPAPSPLFNHDGKAFAGFVRSTPSESYYNNVVDYDQRNVSVAEYKKNVKSGKWRGFVNGE